MSRKWIISLVLILLLEMAPADLATAALDEGNFIPCYSLLQSVINAEPSYHYVEDGDTLWDICRKHNVDLENVMSLNNIDEETLLTVGQKIQLPGLEGGRHIVKKGETLWDIAGSYRISLDELCRVNQGVNPENLKIGTSLVLPKGATSVRSQQVTASRGSLEKLLFSWPVVGAITSGFGWRSSGFHHGIDIAAAYGDTVRAAAAGMVSFTGSKSVYGRTVTIKHADGSESWYAHLSKIFVSRGQQVNRGESIGEIGTSGNSTGPHVHFEVRKGNKAIDPSSILR